MVNFKRFDKYSRHVSSTPGTHGELSHLGFSPRQISSERILVIPSGTSGHELESAPNAIGVDPLSGGFESLNPAAKGRVIAAKAQNLPFRANSFDHAGSHFGIGYHAAISLTHSVAELLRVVRPGGSIRLLLHQSPPKGFAAKLDRLDRLLKAAGAQTTYETYRPDDLTASSLFKVWHIKKSEAFDLAGLTAALRSAHL